MSNSNALSNELDRLEDTLKQGNNQNQKYTSSTKQQTFEEFNQLLGIPERNGQKKLYPFQLERIIQLIEQYKRLWLKKCTGIGASWIILRYMAYLAQRPEYENSQFVIITGPRLELAVNLISRIKQELQDKVEYPKTKETVIKLGSCIIEAYPSHHVADARGLPNCKFIFVDEADFFPPGQQEEVRNVVERYIGKSDPFITLVSTPNLPGGLFEKIEKEPEKVYRKEFIDYTIPLKQGFFTQQQIDDAIKSPSFEREYNLKYGYGIGNIFPYQILDQCMSNYPLSLTDGQKELAIDPAYGSSMFGIVGVEKIGDIIYVKEATQYERPSPSAMLEIVTQTAKKYGHALVDSAHPGLITDLTLRNITAEPIKFNIELSDMTIKSAQAVKELKVRIHPMFSDLLYQLRAVEFNEKGHPDKKKLTFDLGDAFIMAVSHIVGGYGVGISSIEAEERAEETKHKSSIIIRNA